MHQVGLRHLLPRATGPPDRTGDGAERRTPPQDEEFGVARRVVHHELGDVVRDPRDLGLPELCHAFVVLGVVGDVAGDVLLLQPAHAVAQAGRAGDGPGPGQVLVAQVRHEAVVVIGRGGELRIDVGEILDVRQLPRLARVPQERVRQQD